jgi:hypothetical protein
LAEAAWVLPVGPESGPDRIAVDPKRVADEYQATYRREWEEFFADLEIPRPTSVTEALETYGELRMSEYPYRRLLQPLRDNTQWPDTDPLKGRSKLAGKLGGALQAQLMTSSGGYRFPPIDFAKLTSKASAVPLAWKSMVSFGISSGETDVYHYVELLTKLVSTIHKRRRANPELDLDAFTSELADARKDAAALLLDYDDRAKRLLEPLLMAPLTPATHRAPR